MLGVSFTGRVTSMTHQASKRCQTPFSPFFNEYDSLPGGLNTFLKTPATEAHRLLGGKSALIRLFNDASNDGHKEAPLSEPLFVSVLQHGNEITGWLALQKLFRDGFESAQPKRPLWIWVGNVSAAAEGLRQLPGQPDYNRLWAAPDSAPNQFGRLYPFTFEEKMACALLERLRGTKFFAGIDIHNTSGKNPHYGCLNQLDPQFFFLASLFNKNVIYFTKPHEVLCNQLSVMMPAITLECGQPGTEAGVSKAAEVVRDLLTRETFPEHEVTQSELNIYRSFARIVIDESANVSFDPMFAEDGLYNEDESSLIFDPAIDRWNLVAVPEGTCLGRGRDPLQIRVLDEENRDVTSKVLLLKDGKIFAVGDWVPAMFTTTPSIAKSDCLGYVMERYVPEN